MVFLLSLDPLEQFRCSGGVLPSADALVKHRQAVPGIRIDWIHADCSLKVGDSVLDVAGRPMGFTFGQGTEATGRNSTIGDGGFFEDLVVLTRLPLQHERGMKIVEVRGRPWEGEPLHRDPFGVGEFSIHVHRKSREQPRRRKVGLQSQSLARSLG